MQRLCCADLTVARRGLDSRGCAPTMQYYGSSNVPNTAEYEAAACLAADADADMKNRWKAAKALFASRRASDARTYVGKGVDLVVCP